ncbi:39S ribosomal protein L37, mitochondrial [Anoplophora glabripennis]|uniref:39S ribosomal protein L37, mitochondrial n=1 Tax=Anoplophora glabripennis TaxID=217634 RepID=UPI0008738D3D|nr:39S ribosomal protein L37, mitochondrial [Anoplophora glabripennis]
MKRTSVLLRQHIGWHFEKHWRVQGKRKPLNTGAEKILKERNIPFCQPEDIIQEKRVFEKVEIVGFKNKPVVFDKTHPDWHDRPVLSYKDNNVLLEGLTQAKVLTKSVEVKEGLPENIVLEDIPKDIKKHVKNIILSSCVFDAEQKKLPKIKDPERPAWNFPRFYGITQNRANKLLMSRLLQLIESTCGRDDLVNERYLFNDLLFSFPFERHGDLIQFQLSGDTVITSSKPLSPITGVSTESLELPDITPVKPTITLVKDNIYKLEKSFPIKSFVSKLHPHTIFTRYNKEEVKNLFEEEVTEAQIFGRSLLKAFTVSASYARYQFGDDVGQLPKPVTVQSVQTDGQFYHFGVFQLNTLDLEKGDVKNVWYQTPLLYLYDKCCYVLGKPTLEGYNKEVVKHLYAFYNSV